MGEQSATGAATATGATTQRLAWVDVAKGACIVLVVLVHVTTKHLARLDDANHGIQADWITIGRWLRPIRMPLFFLLSGLLSASAFATRPDKVRQRIVRSAELYVIWLVVHTVAIDLYFHPNAATTTVDGFLHALLLPTGSLWYLWALPVYMAALAVIPKRWRLLALAPIAGLSFLVAAHVWEFSGRPRDLLQYPIWFAFGAVLPQVVRGVVDRVTDLRAALVVAVFAVATAEFRQFLPESLPLLQALGVLAGLAVAARLRGRVVDGLSVLGQHTLSIYVLHVPLLTIWSRVLRNADWHGHLPIDEIFWIYPIAICAVLIAVSLAMESGLRRIGAGRLFGDR